MKRETWFDKATDICVFHVPRVVEVFMAVNLIGLALLTKGGWAFDALLATAVIQLLSVIVPLIKKPVWLNEHLGRMYAALIAIAVTGGYIFTSASGVAAWILVLNFIFFDTVLAYRLAVMTMENGKPSDIASDPHGDGRDSRGVGGTHPILSANPKATQREAGGSSPRPQRAVAG